MKPKEYPLNLFRYSVPCLKALFFTCFIAGTTSVLSAQTPTTIASFTVSPSDVIGGSTTALEGTITIQRGTDFEGKTVTGDIPYNIDSAGSGSVSVDRFLCSSFRPNGNFGFDCTIPDGSSSATFKLIAGPVILNGPDSTLAVFGDLISSRPPQTASAPVLVRRQQMTLQLSPSTIPRGIPTVVTATASFLAPPEPQLLDTSFPRLSDPIFTSNPFSRDVNAIEGRLFVTGGGASLLPSEWFIDPFFFSPPEATVIGPAGGNRLVKQFTITSNTGSPIPFTFIYATGLSSNVTATSTLMVDSPGSKFRLLVRDFQSENDLSSFDFTDSTATAPQQTLKVGQEVRIFVFPVEPDGTEDNLLAVTEGISQVKDLSPSDSEIFNNRKELFPQRVVLHFPVTNFSQFHHLFAVHSGTANVRLTFQTQGKSFAITLPIKVTNCTTGDCDAALGKSHSEFDGLLMKFADRNGVPPQLLKAQIQNESNFRPRAFRYEPLSVDFGQFTAPAHGMGFGFLDGQSFRPWALARSTDCTVAHIFFPQGDNLDLASEDATARNQYALSHDDKGVPLCRVTDANQVANPISIAPDDILPTMENVFYTNDNDQSVNNWSAVAIKQRSSALPRFYDYQVSNPPFTAQTVLASSYGLHQIMYATAVGMGYVDGNGVGLSPGNLFEPSISLDLGTQYVAVKFRTTHGAENLDYENTEDFLFQFGPALRAFNAGSSKLTVADFKVGCSAKPPAAFVYACSILKNSTTFVPAPLPGGGD